MRPIGRHHNPLNPLNLLNLLNPLNLLNLCMWVTVHYSP